MASVTPPYQLADLPKLFHVFHYTRQGCALIGILFYSRVVLSHTRRKAQQCTFKLVAHNRYSLYTGILVYLPQPAYSISRLPPSPRLLTRASTNPAQGGRGGRGITQTRLKRDVDPDWLGIQVKYYSLNNAYDIYN